MQVVHFSVDNFETLAYYAPFRQKTTLSYKNSNVHVKSMCYS